MNAHELPDGFFRFLDNAVVERILLQLGVRERFEFPADIEINTFFYSMDDHPTHWLLAARFRDFPDPADNGFMLIGWPKSVFSAKEAKKAAAEFASNDGRFKPERTFIYEERKG